jgi:hypothetical protein
VFPVMRVCSSAMQVTEFVRFRDGTSQFSVGDSHGKFMVEEEYKKSTCEDLICDLKTLCVL